MTTWELEPGEGRLTVMMKSSVHGHVSKRRLRLVALAGAAVVLAAACGGSKSELSGPPILKVFGDQPESRLSQVSATTGEQMTMLAKMRFEIEGDLPTLDGTAPAYEISRGEPDQGKVNRLLDIFGIEGELTAQTAQSGGGYFAGSTDGTGPALYVSGDAVQFWNYSPPVSQTSVNPACLETDGIQPVAPPTPVTDSVVVADTEPDEAVPEDEVSVDPCPNDGAPQDVPAEDEALQMFSDLMSDIDIDVDSLDIEIFSDSYGSSVSGFLRVGGVRSSLSWNVSYGEGSRIVWAGGVLADTEKLADYPRIGTSAALDRLNAQQAGLLDQMTGEDLAAASGTSDDIVVRIVDVEEELVMLYGVDGTVYLVPGYAFLAEPDDFGYRPRYTVSAVPTEYVEAVAPPAVEDGSTGEESGPGVGGSASIPDESGGGMDQEITTEQANTLLGMSEAEATSTATANGWVVRVAARDGEQFALTMDYNWLRVNLTIDGGVVTDVFIG